jgi:hypothetical protein
MHLTPFHLMSMLSTLLSPASSLRYSAEKESDAMNTITIFPENPRAPTAQFRAVAGEKQSVGATAGEALDALTAQLGEPQVTTLVVVQPLQADALFTAEQQQRLAELMTRWRAARDAGTPFPLEEQTELDALVAAELHAALQRSAALARQLLP